VIARALTSDVCSRINVAVCVVIAGGRLNDFAYSLYVLLLFSDFVLVLRVLGLYQRRRDGVKGTSPA